MGRITAAPQMVMPAQSPEERAYRLRYGWRTARLRAQSSYLLNQNGHPTLGNPYTAGEPSPWQPFPTTAADLIAALGATGAILPADVAGIYLLDTASPETDSLGLGPNLPAVVAGGGPLTGREGVGLPTAPFNSKVGVELLEAGFASFTDAGNAFGNVAEGGVFSFIMVLRFNPNATGNGRMLSKEVGNLWTLAGVPSVGYTLYAGPTYVPAAVAVPFNDGAWTCMAGVLDSRVLGAHTHSLFTDRGDATSAPYATVLTNLGHFSLGAAPGASSGFQCVYLACLTKPLTSVMRAAFWRHANPAALGTPNVYTRSGPIITPITAHRVCAYAAGQLPVGYAAGLASAARGNAGGTGVATEDGITFEPIGSDDCYTNTNASGGAKASVDGASAMRDGVRATMAAAWLADFSWLPNAGVAIAGASNVPWRADVNYRRATVGTTGRMGLYFTGDPGGAETFTLLSDAATPADWLRGGGTCTPTRAAHTKVYIIFGAAANGENCDFSEFSLVKNRTTAPLAWRRVGTAASAATSTPTLVVTNVGNRRYNPARGSVELIIGGFALTNGATFICYGGVGAPGGLVLDYSAGQLRLRIWDAAAALAATVLCGAIDATEWKLRVSWNARNPLNGIIGQHVAVERINPAGASPTLLGSWAGTWTPPTADVNPLYTGTDHAGANAARCMIAEA